MALRGGFMFSCLAVCSTSPKQPELRARAQPPAEPRRSPTRICSSECTPLGGLWEPLEQAENLQEFRLQTDPSDNQVVLASLSTLLYKCLYMVSACLPEPNAPGTGFVNLNVSDTDEPLLDGGASRPPVLPTRSSEAAPVP